MLQLVVPCSHRGRGAGYASGWTWSWPSPPIVAGYALQGTHPGWAPRRRRQRWAGMISIGCEWYLGSSRACWCLARPAGGLFGGGWNFCISNCKNKIQTIQPLVIFLARTTGTFPFDPGVAGGLPGPLGSAGEPGESLRKGRRGAVTAVGGTRYRVRGAGYAIQGTQACYSGRGTVLVGGAL